MRCIALTLSIILLSTPTSRRSERRANRSVTLQPTNEHRASIPMQLKSNRYLYQYQLVYLLGQPATAGNYPPTLLFLFCVEHMRRSS